MNRVSLLGRLTRDTEIRTTAGGKSVTSFTIAVNRPFMKDGVREADYINCVAWRGAETINQYFKKGSQIAVTGSLQTRTYENRDGNNVFVTEVIVDGFDFVDKKESNEEKNIKEVKVEEDNDPFKDFGDEIELDDDSLPF